MYGGKVCSIYIQVFKQPQENYTNLILAEFNPMGYVIIMKICRVSLHYSKTIVPNYAGKMETAEKDLGKGGSR